MTWLPEIVKLMRSLSGNSAEVSVNELAELIEKDPAILAKVIGAANTMAFNPSGVAVTGIHQAIHVIGYERIRTLAMSLALSESSTRTRSPDQQREAVAIALTAGCIAQSMGGRRVAIDPGQAFVCASLRNFGRIVMTACMPEEYRAARERASGVEEDEVFREMFGLTSLELGRELLKSADLPQEIVDALRDLPPEAFDVLEGTADERMLALADFSGRLAQLALEASTSPEAFVQDYRTLASRYEKLLPGACDEVQSVLEEAQGKLSELVRNLRLSGVSLRSLNRLRRHCSLLATTADAPEGEKVAAAPPAAKAFPTTASPGSMAPRAALATPAASPAATASPASASEPPVKRPASPGSSRPFDWRDEELRFTTYFRLPDLSRPKLLAFLMDRLCLGLDSSDCLVFTGAPGQNARKLVGGRGSFFQALPPDIRVSSEERTVFGICLSRAENVLIQQARVAGIQAYLPPWLATASPFEAFLLLPLAAPSRMQGVIFVGWRHSGQAQLDSGHVRLLRQLLVLSAEAYDRLP